MTDNNKLSLLPNQWQMMRQQADMLIKSHFLPKDIVTPEQAITIMLWGEALGIKPIIALYNINIIAGKPCISPALMLAQARSTGELEDLIINETADNCSVTIKRKNQTPYTYSFNQDDAIRLNLAGKDNWKKQPAIMRKWRAVSGNFRITFGDVIMGLYTPEEMGANGEYNDIGEYTIIHEESAAEPPVLELSQPQPDLHWVQSPVKFVKFQEQARFRGFENLEQITQLIGPLEDFATVKEALLALEATKTAPVELNPTENQADIVKDWLWDNFGRREIETAEAMGLENVLLFNEDVFANVLEAQTAIRETAFANNWDVRSKSCRVVKTSTGGIRLVLLTALGDLSTYSRQEFLSKIGKKADSKWQALATVEKGEFKFPEPICVQWEMKENGSGKSVPKIVGIEVI